MKIGIPKEVYTGETCVAVVPSMISLLTKTGAEVMVESGAGGFFSDEAYQKYGAQITDSKTIFSGSDIILKVQPPTLHPQLGQDESLLIKEGGVWIGFLAPLENTAAIRNFTERNVTSFSMEFVPRITRAQSMDALSSMATISGYKGVLIAANHLPKIFPLLMTAAGTVAPANVLVLGAGVAGLQAIATARRLGAKVEAFDPRPAVKEQVKSLGAGFVEMELPEEDLETSGGYAREQSDAFLLKEQEAIGSRLAKVDVVITTAQIFGKKAPVLITEEMVEKMPAGAVIVDLATGSGGNCALTQAGKTVVHKGVTIFGVQNLPATISVHASQMYSKNIVNLYKQIVREDGFDFDDEITGGACITHRGEVVNQLVKEAIEREA